MLPAARTVTVIGGPGYEYFNSFTGRNYPPAHPGAAAEARESGKWRIEVSPNRAERDDLFLNALQIANSSVNAPVEARLLSGMNRNAAGVQLVSAGENEVVAFAAGLPLAYELTSTEPAGHLVVDLPPLQTVTVEVNGRRVSRNKVSSQGTLFFRDTGTGKRRIAIKARD